MFGIEQKTHESESRFYPLLNSSHDVKELTRSDYLRLYQSWVYSCTSSIADTMASLEWRLERNGKEVQHRHTDLITADFIRQVASHMLLTGNAYFLKTELGSRIDSLDLLRSDMMIIEEDQDGALQFYRYNARKQYILYPRQIVNFSLFSPFKTYPYEVKGVSPVSAIAIQAEMDKVANRWNWNFFKNGATIGSLLSTDQEISPENKNLLIRKWKEQFGGVANSNSVAVLDKGLKYQTVPTSKKEMDFVESKRFTRDEIFGIFKVPPAIVGITENVNRASAQVAIETYMRFCIAPLAKQIQEVITKELFYLVGDFKFVNIIPEDPALLQSDLQLGAITIDEYRQRRGYPVQKAETPQKGVFSDVIFKGMKDIEEGKIREEMGQKKWEKKIKRTDEHEKRIADKVRIIFSKQRADILKNIQKKEFKLENIDILKWNLMWLELTQDYKDVWLTEGALALSELGISDAFNIGNPQVNKKITESIALLAKNTDDYTLSQIEKLIKEGNESGLGAIELAKAISGAFDSFEKTRAPRIARTEVTTASNMAEIQAWNDSGVVQGKEWYTALDERTCPHCGGMHKTKIGLNSDFFKKGDRLENEGEKLKLDYRNIGGPALHTNCRCVLLPVV